MTTRKCMDCHKILWAGNPDEVTLDICGECWIDRRVMKEMKKCMDHCASCDICVVKGRHPNNIETLDPETMKPCYEGSAYLGEWLSALEEYLPKMRQVNFPWK